MQAGPPGRLRAGQLCGAAPGRGKRVPRPPPHYPGVHLQREGGEERGAPGPRPPARGAGSGQRRPPRRAAPRGVPAYSPPPPRGGGPWGQACARTSGARRGALCAEPPLPAAFPSFPAARRGPASGREHNKTVAGPPEASGSLGAPCCASRGARGLRGTTPTPPGARGARIPDGPLAAPAPGRLLLGHLRLAETPPPPGPTPPPTPPPTPERRSPRAGCSRTPPLGNSGVPAPGAAASRARGGGAPTRPSSLHAEPRVLRAGVPAADSGGRPLPRDPDSITGVARTHGLQKPTPPNAGAPREPGAEAEARETGQGRKINKRRLMAAVIMAVIMDLFQLKRVDWGGVGALRGWCASRDRPESMAG
eukprot:XP_013963124.1 proline-rich protein 2-like [Canis lupus familiaris]